jgi:uncharacterized protein (DUF58 family)
MSLAAVMKLLSAALALLLLPIAHSQAELKWERPVQEFQRSPEDKFVEARFAFKNVGSAPVTIRNTRTSCGCTTARLDKKTYAPGESGEITAKFTFGSRKGYQRKTVTVYTEGKQEPEAVLDMRVDVQPSFTVAPAMVLWRVGEAPADKAIQLSAAGGRKVRVKSVTSSNPRVQARLETSAEGERYRLVVKPVSTERKEAAVLRVETDFPSDAPRTYTIHARIK